MNHSRPLSTLRGLFRQKRFVVGLLTKPFRKHRLSDFDSGWYLQAYPDVREQNARPLVHYLKSGLREGRAPNAFACHFDRNWYLDRYPDVAKSRADPLEHFLTIGANEGRAPNAQLATLFDSEWYASTYTDVAASGVPPLLHFMQHGIAEGRAPNALVFNFDAGWYLQAYPDVAKAGADPLRHFLERGMSEGRSPCARLKHFDGLWYAEFNSDVREANQNPLAHYLRFGQLEGRAQNAAASEFDASWYCKKYPDVGESGLDPLQHFLEHGRTEGRHASSASEARTRALMPRKDNTKVDALVSDLVASDEIGAATVLEFRRDNVFQVVAKFQPYHPLHVVVDETRGAAAKLQILLPSVRKEHATGGPNTAFLLGALLAQRGLRVGFVSTSASPDLDSTAIDKHFKTLTGFTPQALSIVFEDASDPDHPLTVNHNDIFLATAWWTAQAAKSILSRTRASRFYYLIQDFEPLFHAASENWCQAIETYDFDHVPIINTTLLRDYLSEEAIGKFAEPAFRASALAFEPAVDQTLFYPEPRTRNSPRRLLFYARPTIAQRNLFGMGVAALKAAVTAGLFGDGGWEFLGIGERFDEVSLGRGYTLAPAPWLNLEGYAAQMRGADVLLSLMLSPHPSYPPLEMAACGGMVVTTAYGSKTPERLNALSKRIIGVAPSISSLVWGLQRAVRRCDDIHADVGAAIDLPSTWQESMAPILPGLIRELAKDGILPVNEDSDLPAAETATSLSLTGEHAAFYASRRLASRDAYRPPGTPGLISLITTVYDTDAAQLADLAHSVFAQDADVDFEWVLLDNGSSQPATLAMMERLRQDRRVKFGRVDQNHGIIRGMRWCLENASGRYVVPVDSDDLLFPGCLRVLGAFIEQSGFPPLLYTDEDKTDGQRQAHLYSKPDWDPVLFIHSCYIAHVTALDRAKALELGCYGNSEADGSHDWDSFVRFLIGGHAPVHLAEPLYTWRMHAGSTSSNYRSKDYIYESQKYVLNNFLRGKSLSDVYAVAPSPIFDGTPDWRFIPRTPQPDDWLASLIVAAAPEGGVSSRINTDAVHALPPSVTHIHLRSEDCTVVASDWAAEARTLLDLFPETVVIGGRIHNGEVIREAGYVFGYGGIVGCPDAGRSIADPGYSAQMWKPHSVGAVSARHCVVERKFLAAALEQVPADVDVSQLGAWIGALALERRARVVYSPFFEGRIGDDARVSGLHADLPALVARFGHLIRNQVGYAPRLDSSGLQAYVPGDAAAAIPRPSYAKYLADNSERRRRERSAEPKVAPISVLTTVYRKTDPALFIETARCIAGQTLAPLEWIVLAHGPVEVSLDSALDGLSEQGAIRLLRLETNLGIAGGLRHCLEAARGTFVLPLDADDLLELDAIATLTDSIDQQPQAHAFYSDEDLLIGGLPCHPYARPDFDPALLSAHSYVWHAIAFRRATGLALGVFNNRGAEYAQDWDTLIRFMLAGHTPHHVPEVLYHWRQHDHSLSHSGKVFEGSLASIRQLLADVSHATGHPERYAVRPYPYRIGEIDYHIHRHRIEAPPVLRLDLGQRAGRTVCHEADFDFPFVSQVRIAGERGGSAVQALATALANSTAELVLLLNSGGTLLDEQGIWQAIKQLELVPQALCVGGPLVDIGGVVRFGAVVELPDRTLTDPVRGHPLVDPGAFSLALKPHCVTMVSPDLMLARRAPLLEALQSAPPEVTLRGLGAWLGVHCRQHQRHMIYEPMFCAGLDDRNALVGDPLEALQRHWQWLAPESGAAPRPIQGLAGFAWHALHHE